MSCLLSLLLKRQVTASTDKRGNHGGSGGTNGYQCNILERIHWRILPIVSFLFSSAIIHTLSKQIEEARETLAKERSER